MLHFSVIVSVDFPSMKKALRKWDSLAEEQSLRLESDC